VWYVKIEITGKLTVNNIIIRFLIVNRISLILQSVCCS